MAGDLYVHYQAVLDDLQQRKQSLAQSIKELDGMIAGIQRQLGTVASPGDTHPEVGSATPTVVSGEYSNMSVRWAILKLLAEGPTSSMATGDVATTLEGGGVTSKGQRFASVVSAVLSGMKNKKQEIEMADGGMYRLSAVGRQAWEAIKNSPRYLNRHA